MKKTIREKIECELEMTKIDIISLENNIRQCIDKGDYLNASVNKTKCEILKTIAIRLNNILQ